MGNWCGKTQTQTQTLIIISTHKVSDAQQVTIDFALQDTNDDYASIIDEQKNNDINKQITEYIERLKTTISKFANIDISKIDFSKSYAFLHSDEFYIKLYTSFYYAYKAKTLL